MARTVVPEQSIARIPRAGFHATVTGSIRSGEADGDLAWLSTETSR